MGKAATIMARVGVARWFHALPKWRRRLAGWTVVGAAFAMVALGEYAIASGVLFVALLAFTMQILDWRGLVGKPRWTTFFKVLSWMGVVLMLVCLGIIFTRIKATKEWSNFAWGDIFTVQSYLTYFLVVNWRWLAIIVAIVVAFLLGRFFNRQSETRAPELPPQQGAGTHTLEISDSLHGCQDEWLHEVLKDDKKSIGDLVKVFIVGWEPEFSNDILQPYIDFRFAISNISLHAVMFEDSIGGYITFLKTGAKKRSGFKEKPSLAPSQELYVLPRKPAVLIVRQYVDRKEAEEIEASGNSSQFWLHELEVYFYGKEIDRTQLDTRQVVRKDGRWIAQPELYFAYDNKHSVAAKIETLTAENEWLKSRPSTSGQTDADLQNAIFTFPDASLEKLQSDHCITFTIRVFHALGCQVSIPEEVDGFILLDEKALPHKPRISVHTYEPPNDRSSIITLTQSIDDHMAHRIHGRILNGEKLIFLFTSLRVDLVIDGERHRLRLPGGVSCESGIRTRYVITASANWTIPGGKVKAD